MLLFWTDLFCVLESGLQQFGVARFQWAHGDITESRGRLVIERGGVLGEKVFCKRTFFTKEHTTMQEVNGLTIALPASRAALHKILRQGAQKMLAQAIEAAGWRGWQLLILWVARVYSPVFAGHFRAMSTRARR